MNEDQMTQDAREFRVLSDDKASNVLRQCRVLAKYYGDSKALSDLAKILDPIRRQTLVKYSGAGAVMDKFAVEDQDLEWLYQVSLFADCWWEQIIDYALLVGLNAGELSALRKMMDAGFCPLCGGENEETN